MSLVGAARKEGRRSFAVPGDGLLRPVPLFAIAVLLINDHVLKGAAPGLITGKLSDFAGAAFFPLFLVAVWEVGLAVTGVQRIAGSRVLTLMIVITAACFSAVKLLPIANEAYSVGVGLAQWAITLPFALFLGFEASGPWSVHLTADPTDVVALIALPLAFWDGRTRAQAAGRWT